MGKIIKTILWFGFAGALLTCVFSGPASSKETTETSDRPKGNIPRVSALTLAHDYAENELAADEKYSGKGGLIIYGKVTSVDRTFGKINLTLTDDSGSSSDFELDFHSSVNIELQESQADKAKQLRKGHRTTVICKDVEDTAGFVEASGCVFTDE